MRMSRDVCSISVDRARRGVLRGGADPSARSWEHRPRLGVSGLRRSWRTYVGGCNVTLAVGNHAPIYFGLHAWSASRRRREKRKKTRARNRPRVYLRGVLSTVALPPQEYAKLDRGGEGGQVGRGSYFCLPSSIKDNYSSPSQEHAHGTCTWLEVNEETEISRVARAACLSSHPLFYNG